jgi:hypothetical protein
MFNKKISDVEWKHYIDTGEVSNAIIENLVNMIINNKELSIKDIAIYINNSNTIEYLLKKK